MPSELVVIEYPHSQLLVAEPKRSGRTAKIQDEAIEACADGRGRIVLAGTHVRLASYAIPCSGDGICRDQKRATGARAKEQARSEGKRGRTENDVSVARRSHVQEHEDTGKDANRRYQELGDL